MKKRIYLDDVRTPILKDEWVIVRNYEEFVDKITEIGLENIELISSLVESGKELVNLLTNKVHSLAKKEMQ